LIKINNNNFSYSIAVVFVLSGLVAFYALVLNGEKLVSIALGLGIIVIDIFIIIPLLKAPILLLMDDKLLIRRLFRPPTIIGLESIRIFKLDMGVQTWSIKGFPPIGYYKLIYRRNGDDYEIIFSNYLSNANKIKLLVEKIKSTNPYFKSELFN